MQRDRLANARIVVGEDTLALWRKGSSYPTVAMILGRHKTEAAERITVDRVLHMGSDIFEEGWRADGPFVSEFSRAPQGSDHS